MPAARANKCCWSLPTRKRRSLRDGVRAMSRASVVQPFGDIWLRDTAAIIRGDGVAADFPVQRLGRQV